MTIASSLVPGMVTRDGLSAPCRGEPAPTSATGGYVRPVKSRSGR